MAQPGDDIPLGLTWQRFRSAYAKDHKGAPNREVSTAWKRYKSRGTRAPSPRKSPPKVSKTPSPKRKSTKGKSPVRKSPEKKASPRKEEERVVGERKVAYVAWIDYETDVRQNPLQDDRFPELSLAAMAHLRRDLSTEARLAGGDVVGIENAPFRTLKVHLVVPEGVDEKRLLDATFKYAHVYWLGARKVLLSIQEGPSIGMTGKGELPLTGTPLTIEARWNTPVILEEEDAEVAGVNPEDEYYISNLDDVLGRTEALITLYSRSSVTLMDGIRLVDAQILPANKLLLTFIPQQGVDVEAGVRKLVGSDRSIDSLGINAMGIHRVRVSRDEDGELVISFDEKERTQTSLDISVPKNSPYIPASVPPAPRKPAAAAKGGKTAKK